LHRRWPLTFGVWLATALPLAAAPPTLTALTPRGAERGKPVEVVVTGTNLTPQAQLLLPFKAEQTPLPDAKPNPTQVRIRVTVDASVPLGAYPVRVVTEEGVSGLQLFSVDAFPNVNEVEDNNSFEKAQPVPVPVAITGQCTGGDVDYFRFPAKKGQKLVIETEAARLGSGVLPQLRLTDGKQRRFLAADDSQRFRGDCRILFTVPADGDYVIEFSDARYRGAAPPHYRLKIAEYDVIDEVFPLGGRRGETVEFTLRGGTLTSEVKVRRALDDGSSRGSMLLGLDGVLKVGMLSPRVVVGELPERLWIKDFGKDSRALEVLPPVTLNGRLERPGDSDHIQFAVKPGQRFRITVEAEALGSYLDGVLRVTDQAGKQLALVDDVALPPAAPGLQPTQSADPSLELTVPADANLLRVELRDQRRRGGTNFGYRLTIEPAVPDFVLQQSVAEVNVPRNGSVVLALNVVRRGYTGPIQLTVPSLPRGLTMQGGHVPANGTRGVLTLTATPEVPVPAGPWSLAIEGTATLDGQTIRRRAEQKIVLSRDGNVAASLLTLAGFAVGVSSAEPFTVQGPPTLEVVKGYPATLPVTIARATNFLTFPVDVTGLIPGAVPGQPPPPGSLAFKPAVIPADAANGAVTVSAPLNAPEGQMDLVLQGKAKVNKADWTVFSQALRVTVLSPFRVEPAAPTLTLVPGQTVGFKAKLIRQPVFKEAVQLKLDGLPKGVTLAAPLVPVPATASEFQLELKVAPKVPAATGNLTLTCSANIAGAAYVHPPVTVAYQIPAPK
jgi:hypothetical protein